MSASKYVSQLRKLEGAVTEIKDPWLNPLRCPSPSVNSIFGNSWGLPRGFSTLLWGPFKGGKSLLSNSFAGECHRNDPESIVIIFDTEMRRGGQMTPEVAASYGIDLERLVLFEGNDPTQVWDRLQKDVADICEQGGQVPLVIIDSISGVMGRQEVDSDTVTKQLRGDAARTTAVGLQRILGVQRKYGFHMIFTAQQRSEMDQMKVMRGMDTKAAVSHGALHHCEFFVYVERNETKAGRVDELGNEFKDASRKDVTDSEEITGHRVKVWMQDSSMGPKGRTGEFTLDYKRGIINQHEEVFKMGHRWGVIKRPNALTYEYGGQKWAGKPAILRALAEDVKLQGLIVRDMMAMDKAGYQPPAAE